MLRNLLGRHYKPALKRAGLPESFRIYDLRHSSATLLLSAGEHAKVVSERLGHSSIVLTLDTYSHVLPSMQRRLHKNSKTSSTEKADTLLTHQNN